MNRIVVIGAGGHARVVCDVIELSGDQIVAVLDDDPALWGKSLRGLKADGPVERIYAMRCDGAIVAIGDNRSRQYVFERLRIGGIAMLNAIHPQAVIPRDVELGQGIVAFANVVVNTGTRIGDNVILNTACTVDHDCVIGAHSHLAPGSHLAGGIRVGDGTLVGIGSVITPNLKIGAWAIVGAGSAVVNDVDAGITVAGVPARAIHREAKT